MTLYGASAVLPKKVYPIIDGNNDTQQATTASPGGNVGTVGMDLTLGGNFGSGSFHRNVFLRFPISAARLPASILHLMVIDRNDGIGGSFVFRRVLRAWDACTMTRGVYQAGVSWQTAMGEGALDIDLNNGVTITNTTGSGLNVPVVVDLSPIARDAVKAGDRYLQIIMYGTGNNGNALYLAGVQSLNPAIRPYISAAR